MFRVDRRYCTTHESFETKPWVNVCVTVVRDNGLDAIMNNQCILVDTVTFLAEDVFEDQVFTFEEIRSERPVVTVTERRFATEWEEVCESYEVVP